MECRQRGHRDAVNENAVNADLTDIAVN